MTEAGVPVAAAVDGDGSVLSGVLPVGRYATMIYVGHPAKLADATAELLAWASPRLGAWSSVSHLICACAGA